MIFVITKSHGDYEAAWDQPIAVRSDFVDAKKLAIANIEPPGENYRMESAEAILVEFADLKCYNVNSSWRSTVLPAMDPTRVYGPTIWPVEDH